MDARNEVKKQPPCFNQNIHPHTFSLFGAASTSIATHDAKIAEVNEGEKKEEGADFSTFATSIFRIVKGIFL